MASDYSQMTLPNETHLALLPLIQQLRDEHRHGVPANELELEIRFGTALEHQRFHPGVPPILYDEVVSQLQTYPHWEAHQQLGETVSHFHQDNYGRPVRTTTYATQGNLVRSLHKRRLQQVTLQRMPRRTQLDGYDIRIALSREEDVPLHDLPALTNTTYVRIQQRNSFFLAGWRYDTTITFNGRTKNEAETAQSSTGVALFELEIECLPEHLNTLLQKTDRCISRTLLAKAESILRLLDDTSFTFSPI